MSAALDAARRSGLIAAGEPLLVMLSGGADSVCLLDVTLKLGAQAGALHVNHGLRGAESEADEAHCRELCGRLGVPLRVERLELDAAAGNLQARAREARYEISASVAEGDYAAAHTRSDQAETVLYRLAASPGRRALLGMAPRRGRLVRPLLEVSRADTRDHCHSHGLSWREDSSNTDPRFARARIRHELLPVLEELAPGAERTIAETAARLREEAELLDALVDAALTDDLAEIVALPPALAREVLRRLAGAPVRAETVLALVGSGGTVSADVGGGLRAVVEYGRLRFTRAREGDEAPAPVELPVPGRASFDGWELTAGHGAQGTGHVELDAEAVGDVLLVRSWRPGDRMRPAGLGGTKTLQDLFTDRKVPRAQRRLVPVVEAGGEIAWVPNVAVGEGFRAREGAPSICLAATLARP